MSETDDLAEVAAAFDRDTDPLAQYNAQFRQLDTDPLTTYLDRVQRPNNASDSTLKNYRQSFDQWRAFMDETGRHFACPNDAHVKDFMQHLEAARGNQSSTILQKVRNLTRAYEWWQEHHAFPQPTDYNPFRLALREVDLDEQSDQMKHPPLDIEDVREVVRQCTNIRERLFLVLQLKFGLRVGELRNIKLDDIALSQSGLDEWYPELGTADPIRDYDRALYVPSRYTRDGNKSHRPRVLPIDDEAKRVLLQYLATRPTVDVPYLILSERTFGQLTNGDMVRQCWKEAFAEHNEDDRYRDITSHYGRYFFTNYWKVKEDAPRELVQYMRGDKLGDSGSSDIIDEYLTAYYEDIRGLYLNRIFKLLA
ncbi:tyrosine-type recombinase/integrase [Haloglomus salinum]|uniref:tyrosine-type recombinase/integrase n=1 Tax=Haloglomus salinum TaxID=2962673 RepID=UPI0020CA25F5|nr:site-specific integrase [Haloglomus salinum]